MTTDSETNFLFLADTLRERKSFIGRLAAILECRHIGYDFLPSAKDIWAVDYMPVQVAKDMFIQFLYDPDYLRNSKYRATRTSTSDVCRAIGLETIESRIRIDGGNVIKGDDWVIVTDKVFNENKDRKGSHIIEELESLFCARVIVIPQSPDDYTGHADGLVRHYNRHTVLINQWASCEDPKYQKRLRESLISQGLGSIEIPYNPCLNANFDMANGLYLNFLQMKDFILLPTFGLKEDEIAYQKFQDLFKGHCIETIDSREIAKDGGVLNCITWNIEV